MTHPEKAFDPFDPTGMLKSLRDSNMEAWSKMMLQLVHTEAYADATGKALETWLSNSMPYRTMLEDVITRTLAHCQLPSRDDLTNLASRLTSIEMRLDDVEAKLDDFLAAQQSSQDRQPCAASAPETN